jgi:hypothetical protein
VNFIVVLLLSVLVGFQTFNAIQKFNSPFTLISAVLNNPVLSTNESLDIDYKLRKSRLCLVQLDRFIQEVDTKEIIWRERIPGSPQAVGPIQVKNKIKLPSQIKPDQEYDLEVIQLSQCSEGVHIDPWPVLRFHTTKEIQ